MKKGEGEEEGGGREGDREGRREREDMLNSVSVVKLAHSEGQPSDEQIIASRLHMGACYIH